MKPRKEAGYAAWLLMRIFDELTGDYFESAAIENQRKPIKGKDARVSDENDVRIGRCDKANGEGEPKRKRLSPKATQQ